MDKKRTSRADRRRNSAPRPDDRRRPPPATATAHSQLAGDELQVYVRSILTADNVANAREVLLKHSLRLPAPVVVLDLQHASYIDTSGLALLFDLQKTIHKEGRKLILQNPSRGVLRMLNITRMARVFTIRMTNPDLSPIPAAKQGAEAKFDPTALTSPSPGTAKAQRD